MTFKTYETGERLQHVLKLLMANEGKYVHIRGLCVTGGQARIIHEQAVNALKLMGFRCDTKPNTYKLRVLPEPKVFWDLPLTQGQTVTGRQTGKSLMMEQMRRMYGPSGPAKNDQVDSL